MKPGSLIAGKYRVVKALSEGGTALVLEARHEALGQRVAVKVLPAEAATHADMALRFQREAQLAARIPGDHVARVSDFGVGDDGSLFIVFELLEGRDLQQEIETRGQLSLREAVDCILQACVGVAEAHALGLVHRDLKPANLFLTQRRDGTPLVKVLDFGIAKAQNELSNTVTGSGTLVTPSFASPEQLRSSRDAGPRSDQYSLAATLFALLVGRPPFYGATLPDLMQEIFTKPVPRPSQLRPGVPAPVDAILARALSKRPDDRYPDLRAFAAAIAPFGSAVSRAHVSTIERALNGAGGAPAPRAAVVPEVDDEEVATVARPRTRPAEGSAAEPPARTRDEAMARPRSIVAGEPIDVAALAAAAEARRAAVPPPEPSDEDGPTQVFRGGRDASKPDARIAELAAAAQRKPEPAKAGSSTPAPALQPPPKAASAALAVPPMPPPPVLSGLAQKVPVPPGGPRTSPAAAPKAETAKAKQKPRPGALGKSRDALAETRLMPRRRGAAGTALTIGLLVLCAVLGALVTYVLAGGGGGSTPAHTK